MVIPVLPLKKMDFPIVFDPYGPNTVPGLAPLSLIADMVLCSHEHGDHGYTDAVTLKHSGTKNPFSITKIDTWHDPEQGALRGPNRIHILESNGLKIAHMGDIGCPLTREQKESVKASRRDPDPVGGYYTIDAVQAKAVVDDLAPTL